MNFFVFKPPYIEYPAIDLRENGNSYEFYVGGEYVESPIYIETTKLATRNGIFRIGEDEYVDFILDPLGSSFLKELLGNLIEKVVQCQSELSYQGNSLNIHKVCLFNIKMWNICDVGFAMFLYMVEKKNSR
jgi:hypothetical protein